MRENPSFILAQAISRIAVSTSSRCLAHADPQAFRQAFIDATPALISEGYLSEALDISFAAIRFAMGRGWGAKSLEGVEIANFSAVCTELFARGGLGVEIAKRIEEYLEAIADPRGGVRWSERRSGYFEERPHDLISNWTKAAELLLTNGEAEYIAERACRLGGNGFLREAAKTFLVQAVAKLHN